MTPDNEKKLMQQLELTNKHLMTIQDLLRALIVQGKQPVQGKEGGIERRQLRGRPVR